MDNDKIQGVEKPFESPEGTIKPDVVSRVDDYFKKVENPEPKQAPQADAQQPEPTPSSEKATEVAVEKPSSVASEQPSVTTPEQSQPNAEENPRTTQRIQELLEENKKLKRQFQEATSVFDDLRPQVQPLAQQAPVQQVQPSTPYLSQQQAQNIRQNFVAPDGTVDIDGLNRALNEANVSAYQSKVQAQSLQSRLERFEETQQALVAHAVVPEIDPKSDKFDPSLFEAVKDRLLRNMYEGKEKRSDPNYLRDVAIQIKQNRSTTTPTVNLDKVREDAVAQYKQSIQQKQQQGPIEAGKGQSRVEAGIEELRDKTRKGDPFALEERLKKAGIIS